MSKTGGFIEIHTATIATKASTTTATNAPHTTKHQNEAQFTSKLTFWLTIPRLSQRQTQYLPRPRGSASLFSESCALRDGKCALTPLLRLPGLASNRCPRVTHTQAERRIGSVSSVL